MFKINDGERPNNEQLKKIYFSLYFLKKILYNGIKRINDWIFIDKVNNYKVGISRNTLIYIESSIYTVYSQKSTYKIE